METLELFVLRRLTAEHMMLALRHLDACAECRAILQFENQFIDAIRAALRRHGWKPS